MSTLLAGGPAAAGLAFSLPQQLTVVGLCALAAYAAHLALAVFNDGVRPFMLDFVHGRTTRGATGAVSFGLSAGFIFGLGAPMALSSGVLNPWLVFLPTDPGHSRAAEVARAAAGRGLGCGGGVRAEGCQRGGA